MVMLAGQVLGSAVFLCLENIKYNKKLKSIKNKKASFDLSIAPDVFLSSFSCKMNGKSHVMGVYIV